MFDEVFVQRGFIQPKNVCENLAFASFVGLPVELEPEAAADFCLRLDMLQLLSESSLLIRDRVNVLQFLFVRLFPRSSIHSRDYRLAKG